MFAHLHCVTHLLLGFHHTDTAMRKESAGQEQLYTAEQSALPAWSQNIFYKPRKHIRSDIHSPWSINCFTQWRRHWNSRVNDNVKTCISTQPGGGNKCQWASISLENVKSSRMSCTYLTIFPQSYIVVCICYNLAGQLTCLECCTFRFMKWQRCRSAVRAAAACQTLRAACMELFWGEKRRLATYGGG